VIFIDHAPLTHNLLTQAMPLPIPPDSPPALPVMEVPYPVTTNQAAGPVDGIHTEVRTTYFSDKIMVTITQNGGLAQWVCLSKHAACQPGLFKWQIQVPMERSNIPSTDLPLLSSTHDDDLLPMPHLNPKTLLGSSTLERETIGQLCATQIASSIATRDPQENRTVLLGLGLSKIEASRTMFYDTIELVMKTL
jgi:proteasome assembly chaperone 3